MTVKKIRRAIAFCLLIFICLSNLTACAFLNPIEPEVREFFGYFDTVCRFRIDERESDGFDAAALEFEKLLSDYDRLFDAFEPADGTVNVFELNANAGKGTYVVDERLFNALEFGVRMHELTDGYCNIAFGSVLSLWRDAKDNVDASAPDASLPSPDAIAEAMKYTDISALVLDRDTLSVKITDHKLSIDLGAIAKGYVADLAAELLSGLGYENFLIDLGGNIVTRGKNHKNSYWSAMIENPYADESKGYRDIIYLNDQTLVTSGSYQRFFTFEGKNYSHVISKDSGMPPEYYLSVSILAPLGSSALADTLSTALFCMPLELGRELAESVEGVEVLWMLSDGRLEMTEGFGGKG